MDILLVIVGILGAGFAMVMTVISAVTLRKPRKIGAFSTLLSGLIAALALMLMMLLGGLRLNPLLGFPLLLFGMLLGYVRGQAVQLQWQGKQVVGKNSILFLLLWGLSLALSQILGMPGSPLLASLGLIPAAFSTGLQMGFYGNLFLRRIFMRLNAQERSNQAGSINSVHTIIGIGGGLALCLLLLITLVFTIPALIRTFPDLTVSAAAAEQGSGMPPAGGTIPLPTPSPTPGYLPQSGSLVINCDAEIQKKMEEENPYGGIEGQQYTFDEIFQNYTSTMTMQVNLSARRFNFYFMEFYTKRDLSYDPASNEDRCSLYISQSTNAESRISEDGWFTGNSQLSRLQDICSESQKDDLRSTFYGFIDDDTASIVYCPMPYPANPEEFQVDLETLRRQGKDELIANWWNPQACSTCTIDQVLP